MRIWLIGAGERGTEVLRQLQKTSNIEVVVTDPKERPAAVVQGVIPKVHHVEVVTPININTLARRIHPDLILIDAGADQSNLGRISGGMTFSDALNNEVAAASEYPCLVI
jgi:FlaA1/EpsC-like NDP-sugar epimerase